MPAISVIAEVVVADGPITAYADEDVFSVIVRIEISELRAWAIIVVDYVAIFWPNDSVIYTAGVGSERLAWILAGVNVSETLGISYL